MRVALDFREQRLGSNTAFVTPIEGYDIKDSMDRLQRDYVVMQKVFTSWL
jgi:hypothetical protein